MSTPAQNPPRGRLMRPVEVGRKLNRDPKTIARWVREGSFPPPAYRIKNKPLWLEPDVDDWLATQAAQVQGAA